MGGGGKGESWNYNERWMVSQAKMFHQNKTPLSKIGLSEGEGALSDGSVSKKDGSQVMGKQMICIERPYQ